MQLRVSPDQTSCFYSIHFRQLIRVSPQASLTQVGDEAVPRAVLWGGLFAAGQLFREFRKKNLWPLYDNLRITKPVLFGCTILVNTLFALGLTMWQI